MLSISGADTTQAQTQLDSFIAKWKSENVDTVILSGLSVADRQFVDKIKQAIPTLQLIADDSSAGNNGQTENKPDTKTTPNSYEGMWSRRACPTPSSSRRRRPEVRQGLRGRDR